MSLKTRATNNAQQALYGDMKNAEFYKIWAETYEKDLEIIQWNYPKVIAEELANLLGERKQARILDVAAGTGLVGLHLKNLGFQNMDALDATPEMLERAREKQLYKNLLCEFVTDKPIPTIEKDTYDALVSAGSFAPNHLKPNCLKDFIRVVKSGGMIVLSVTASYLVDHELLKHLEPTMNDLVTEGLWTLIQKKEHQNLVLGKPGFTFAFSVL